MCLANDFAAPSAPCVKCVRVRLHITPFARFPLTCVFYFTSKSLISCLRRLFPTVEPPASFCPTVAQVQVISFPFLFVFASSSWALRGPLLLVGFMHLQRPFFSFFLPLTGPAPSRHSFMGSLAMLKWLPLNSRPPLLSLLPLITQGHNHRPLWSNSQFAMSPPFNRTASTQAGAASRPRQM